MIQYLAFELCKSNEQSRYIKLFSRNDSFYIKSAVGSNGAYLLDCINRYHCPNETARIISSVIDSLKIYSWPKTIPSDYIPSDRIIGWDTNTWSLDFKEPKKKYARHIFGKGAFPKEESYRFFMNIVARFVPDNEFRS